jgi:L-lactate dehydrogenase
MNRPFSLQRPAGAQPCNYTDTPVSSQKIQGYRRGISPPIIAQTYISQCVSVPDRESSPSVFRMSSCGFTPVSRIAIIGVGQVGSSAAYSIMLHSVAGELLLVDTNTVLRDGQGLDLTDVGYSCNSRTKVRAATHQEARESDIVVITAGSKYSRGMKSDSRRLFEYNIDHMRSNCHIGETSIQHIYQKMSIIESIVKAMKPFRSDTILLIVANPVDLLTSIAYQLSGLPKLQVLGSGTFLDSVRIRNLLAEKTMVCTQHSNYGCGLADSQVDRSKLHRSLRCWNTRGFTGSSMVRCNN